MSFKLFSIIGWILAILGLLGVLLVLFGFAVPGLPPIRGYYGPAAAITFGWLMVVPTLYPGVRIKGFLSLVVVYILSFVGLGSLLAGDVTSRVAMLYAGAGALAFAARQKDSGSSGQLDQDTRACAADTLFALTIVLILMLAFSELSGTSLTMGLLGLAFDKIFSWLGGISSGWSFFKSAGDLFARNVAIEFYAYAVATLFYLSGDRAQSDKRWVPPRIPSLLIFCIGIVVVIVGLYRLFFDFDGTLVKLFSLLLIAGSGLAIAYLGLKRVSA